MWKLTVKPPPPVPVNLIGAPDDPRREISLPAKAGREQARTTKAPIHASEVFLMEKRPFEARYFPHHSRDYSSTMLRNNDREIKFQRPLRAGGVEAGFGTSSVIL